MSEKTIVTPQETFYEEILAELASGKLVLPMLPEVVLKVNDIVENPDASLIAIAEVIGTDVALSARILKTANSPLYRGRYPVENLQTAISRLGLKMARNLVSSLIMEQMFVQTSDRLEKRMHDLWQHSMEVAATCHVLASKQAGIQADEAMLAGLVHDIGVLPILRKAEDWPQFLEDSELLDSVIKDLSIPIGVAILERWDFPESFIAVVAEHQNLERDSIDGPDLVDIVQVANLQSYTNFEESFGANELAAVPAFNKLGVQTDIQIVELDENSEEYAEALALFNAA